MSDSSVPGHLSFKRNVIQVSGRGFSCTEPERSIRPTSMRFAGAIGIKCCIGMSVMIHHRSCRQAPNGIKAEHRILGDASGKPERESVNGYDWKCTRRLFGSVIRPVCCESCRSNTVHLPSDSPAFDRLLLSKGAIRMSDMSWLSFDVNIYYHNGTFLSITFLKNVTIFSEKIRRQKEFLLNS